MNRDVQDTFFKLLRNGLWQEESCDNTIPLLTSEQWDTVYQLSISQTVEALVYDGILKLDPEYFPPRSLMLKWTVRVDALERRSAWMTDIIGETSRLFDLYQVDYVLLKGHSLATCYELPAHRNTGDIDYYIPDRTKFRKMNRLIQERGLKVEKGALYSSHYQWKGCEIEYHTQLLDLVNPLVNNDITRLINQEHTNTRNVSIANNKIPMLSPLLTHVQTNAHILKHFIGFGIGLRQFCDMARVCFCYHKEIDGKLLKETYKKLRIYKWIQLTHSFLIDYLGLSEKYLPFALEKHYDTDWLANDVLTSGNFGFYANKLDQRNWNINTSKGRFSQTKRFLRHLFVGMKYAPGEAIFFPVSKITHYTSLKKII